MMDEKRFDEVIGDLPRGFNTPPEPPLDEMWEVFEDAHFNSPASGRRPAGMTSRAPWLAAAAALVIGVGIGRYVPFGKTSQPNGRAAAAVASTQSPPPGAD